MARIINFSIEVTEAEMENFLARMSGSDGRKIDIQTGSEDAPTVNKHESNPALDTDKNGVAWSPDFHASSKALNADGTWRRRRGLSPEETAAAEEYEKGGASESVAPVIKVSAKDEEVSIDDAPALPASQEVNLPTPTLPTMPGLPTATPAPAPEPVTYDELVALFGQAVAKDASVSANFAELYAKAGVTDPQVLNTDAGAEQRIALAGLLREIIG